MLHLWMWIPKLVSVSFVFSNFVGYVRNPILVEGYIFGSDLSDRRLEPCLCQLNPVCSSLEDAIDPQLFLVMRTCVLSKWLLRCR